ncbi:MAG: hypothetical protein P3X22_000365 [Thermoprotei archaeon]|nr:hypothetical protein [Thermoprotei archaeon]
MSLKLEFRELGLCSRCSAPIEYSYTLSGPEDGGSVRVFLTVDCGVCGFKESKNMVFPLNALYSIRYMFHPTVKIFLEKVRLAAELKKSEEVKVVAGAQG